MMDKEKLRKALKPLIETIIKEDGSNNFTHDELYALYQLVHYATRGKVSLTIFGLDKEQLEQLRVKLNNMI